MSENLLFLYADQFLHRYYSCLGVELHLRLIEDMNDKLRPIIFCFLQGIQSIVRLHEIGGGRCNEQLEMANVHMIY